ncbi:hypothetical protein SAMN05216428_10541 [Nitrosospira sp. Nsp11]|uniref:hypothetical protein n=1 Tax=Nitrosospira sp. Nsp11 TaxID=1855338 RepID=UPI000922984C|nr:hypothetical protein [Nitrosospira sp. Nsp11]SHL69749.1 hypothetical protein SAMN05216428_10541 [Nitrosospira sp. Nsp11]
MAIFTQTQGARSPSVLNLGTLANAAYIASAAIDLGAAIPLDVTLEVECDPSGTPAANRQLILFAKLSLDNINFGSGPETGLTATEEADLHWIGTLPCNDTNTHRKFFSLQGLPTARYLKLVAKNDMGVPLTSGNIYLAEIAGVSA